MDVAYAPFDLIPAEILKMILERLDRPARLMASQVCYLWNVIITNELRFYKEAHDAVEMLANDCAALGHTNLLKVVIQSGVHRDPEEVFRLAVENGHEPITNWLMAIWRGLDPKWGDAAECAAKKGNWKVLRWFWKSGNFKEEAKRHAGYMTIRAPLGDLKQMIWFSEQSRWLVWPKNEFPALVSGMHPTAVANNRRDVASWLVQEYTALLLYDHLMYVHAVTDAGTVEMLRHVLRLYLHDQRQFVFEHINFWEELQEQAVSKKKQELIHECTRVKYWIRLCKTPEQMFETDDFYIAPELVTPRAVEYAIRSGCLTVLDWVSTWSRVENLGSYAYDLAIANKRVSVVHWLLEHKCPPANYLSGVDMQKWRTADDIPAAIYQKARVIVTLQI